MIKTGIKIRVTPVQSKKIQQICFNNGVYWGSKDNTIKLLDKPYLFIEEDGIFDVSDINYIVVDNREVKKVINWIKEKNKFWIASAYATKTEILFAKKPKKFKGNQEGSGFSYGSTNILTNCPKNILILAQND